MTWSARIRQVHRWVSLVFTLAVVANVVANALGEPRVWVGLLALVPLIVLQLTGLYMFALPYLARRGGPSATE